MPEHYAIEKNVFTRTIYFTGTKVCVLDFTDAGFTKPPRVTFTMNDSGAFPAYKRALTETQLIVRLQANWTGSIDVTLMKRS